MTARNKSLKRYLIQVAKKYGKIKLIYKERHEPSRERILTKNGAALVRYHYYGCNDDGSQRDKWSRYEKSCFAYYTEGLEDSINRMISHDWKSLRLVEIRAGIGFKKILKRYP